uniref:Uncharacterized protein n=1 Tax=Solanum lycopersicum TaxID=4081 RepID=A0A3Q7F2J0_SOLLC
MMRRIDLFFKYVVEGAPQVSCYFVFGDSLFVNGNNNDLNTTAKANYVPYGVDFPDVHSEHQTWAYVPDDLDFLD